MQFWNDELRICPKCKAATRIRDEPRGECSNCGSTVWFYNYRQLSPPADLPSPHSADLWSHPQTTALLIAGGILCVTTLVGVFSSMVAVAAAALAAIGFLIYAGMRHAEAVRLEQALAHAKGLQEYAETMRDRAKEAASRYNHLLRTGDTRIETYFHDIYMRAAEERHSAELLRKEAANDRAASAARI